MAGIPPAEWINCVPKPTTSRADGGFEAIEIRIRPADQSHFEPHPKVPSGWTLYHRCPGNLSALLEFLAQGMDQFLAAPSLPGYTVEQTLAKGVRKHIPDPRNVWGRLLCAWQRMKAADIWSHHHRIFTDRPSLPTMPAWPPKVFPPEEFSDRLLWSDLARQSLLEHLPRFEQALSDWNSWAAERAAEMGAPAAGEIPLENYLPLESEIMNALDGKSLRVDALALAVCGGTNKTLYKKPWRGNSKQNVLSCLKSRGDIQHNRQMGGYYRPDRLPAASQPKSPPKRARRQSGEER